MSEWTKEEGQETIGALVRRTMVDPDFRKLAVSDPARAIAEINPKPLPEGFKIQFVDKHGYSETISLPEPVGNADELTVEELEAVAGGGLKDLLGTIGCDCTITCDCTIVTCN